MEILRKVCGTFAEIRRKMFLLISPFLNDPISELGVTRRGLMQFKGAWFLFQGPWFSLQLHRFPLRALRFPYGALLIV